MYLPIRLATKLVTAVTGQKNDDEDVGAFEEDSSMDDQKYLLIDDEELQEYLFAIISARIAGPLDIIEIERFMDNHLEKTTDKATVPPAIPRCQDTLDCMRHTLDAVDFFVEFCIRIFVKAYGSPKSSEGIKPFIYWRPERERAQLLSTALPLSMYSDKRRIRRALLRFQLYCELFHQPGDNSDSMSDWEERPKEQEAFWLRYEWWEVEEVKCIYQVLVFCFENTTAGESHHLPRTLNEETDYQQRGLVQLRRFLDSSVTAPMSFGASYLRRFLARSFHGFRQADPDDYNYFSHPRPVYKQHHVAAGVIPAGTYRTKQRLGKGRKWSPSTYPGVQLEHFNHMPPEEYREGVDREKDKRELVRLVGWVFWRGNDLCDWIEFGKPFATFRLEAGEIDEDLREVCIV